MLSPLSVAETAAGFLPFALRAPLIAVLHTVHFTALFVLAPGTTIWGEWRATRTT